ncbi:reverse transcriptase domain-containing protein [Tanacetum coccineum]
MKLNKKCSFGVKEGKFLGYMVTSKGIRANPKKTKILADLQSPHTLKEMQSLAGKLAALNRFLAKSVERSLLFFNILKKITKENKNEYKWTIKAEEAFQQMKRCIINLSSLTPSFPKETLYAYLTVLKEANILRNQNQKVDVLSKLSSVAFNHLTKELLVEVLNKLSTKGKEINTVVEEERDNWITPIIQCLEKGVWPKDKNEAHNLRMRRPTTSKLYYPKDSHGIMRHAFRSSYHGQKSKTMHEDAKKEIQKFGLPWIIVTDNGTQFVNDPFKSWCKRLNIQQMNTTISHPQAIELIERAKKSLMEGIKTRIGREKAGWAVIPAEIGMPTYRTMTIREGFNEEEIHLNLNLLTKRRELAGIWEASRVEAQRKIGPEWEGPYRVIEAYQNSSYKLQTMEDNEEGTIFQKNLICKNIGFYRMARYLRRNHMIKPLKAKAKRAQPECTTPKCEYKTSKGLAKRVQPECIAPKGEYKTSKGLAKRVQLECIAPKDEYKTSKGLAKRVQPEYIAPKGEYKTSKGLAKRVQPKCMAPKGEN